MQKRYVLFWGTALWLSLSLSSVLNAQNIYESPSNQKTFTALPTPSTLSNDTFKAKVKAQNDSIKNDLDQEAKQQAAALAASSQQQNGQPPSPPPSMPETTETVTTQTTTTEETPPPPSQYENTAPSSNTFAAPPPANTNNNNQNKPSQGGWQIQY